MSLLCINCYLAGLHNALIQTNHRNNHQYMRPRSLPSLIAHAASQPGMASLQKTHCNSPWRLLHIQPFNHSRTHMSQLFATLMASNSHAQEPHTSTFPIAHTTSQPLTATCRFAHKHKGGCVARLACGECGLRQGDGLIKLWLPQGWVCLDGFAGLVRICSQGVGVCDDVRPMAWEPPTHVMGDLQWEPQGMMMVAAQQGAMSSTARGKRAMETPRHCDGNNKACSLDIGTNAKRSEQQRRHGDGKRKRT